MMTMLLVKEKAEWGQPLMSEIVLGIDLASKSSGYAVFQSKKILDYGCITATSTDLIKRIQKITKDLDELVLSKFPIDIIIIEEVRPDTDKTHSNPKVFKALMYLQASIIFLIHDKYPNIKIEFIMPNSWRSKIGIKTGKGIKREELKQKDIEFVEKTFGITVNDDIADACGIAWSYINNQDEDYNWA